MRYLGIDYGTKRTGLATSDDAATLAGPHSVIETENDLYLAEQIVGVIDAEAIGAVVLGLPLNMDGSEGPQAEKVRSFAEQLSVLVSVPIYFHDERLSSDTAESLFPPGEMTRRQKQKRRDAVAAAVFLQSFLDERQSVELPSQSPRLVRLPTAEALADEAAAEFVSAAVEAVGRRGAFYVAISGGKTPRLFFQRLAQAEIAGQVPWDKTFLFWADERCVPPESPDSNYALAKDTFLDAVPIPPEHVYRIHGEYDDCVKAADVYDTVLRNVFALEDDDLPCFDMIVLGLGRDGHIASLLPDDPGVSVTEDLTWPVFNEQNFNRVTLTAPVLQEARRLLVLVAGADKADIVGTIVSSPPEPQRYPVHVLWPVLDKVLWLVDDAAASVL